MRRREFLTILSVGLLARPVRGFGQSDGAAHITLLGPNPVGAIAGTGLKDFSAELQKLGFAQGRNLIQEYGRTDQETNAAIAEARRLINENTVLVVAIGPELALKTALAANPNIPIVLLALNFDPIARGYVKSLAQPGGNITGIFARQPELAAKQLQLLAEAFPERTRVGVLWDAQSADQFSVAEEEARRLHLSFSAVKLEAAPYDFAEAFRSLAKSEPQLLLVLSSPLFATHDKEIAELATHYRLPSMFIFKTYVEVGGLMSYGVDIEPLYRRAASYVAKLLRGAKPSEFPVEQASNFEFALNLRTAKALNVQLPTSILLRADEVIE
jgi:putative tryptophan/tyrosine transport system substrate-binding protein